MPARQLWSSSCLLHDTALTTTPSKPAVSAAPSFRFTDLHTRTELNHHFHAMCRLVHRTYGCESEDALNCDHRDESSFVEERCGRAPPGLEQHCKRLRPGLRDEVTYCFRLDCCERSVSRALNVWASCRRDVSGGGYDELSAEYGLKAERIAYAHYRCRRRYTDEMFAEARRKAVWEYSLRDISRAWPGARWIW